MLKTAFRNNAMKKTALFKWYSKFEQGDIYVTGEGRPGRPSPASTKNLKQSSSCWTLIVR